VEGSKGDYFFDFGRLVLMKPIYKKISDVLEKVSVKEETWGDDVDRSSEECGSSNVIDYCGLLSSV